MSETEYLVSHGCAGHLGRFRAAAGGDLGRGTPVVIRSRRGLELGEVLCPSATDWAALPDPFVGEVVRPATPDDLADADRHRELADRLFDEGARLIAALDLPLTLVDVEV